MTKAKLGKPFQSSLSQPFGTESQKHIQLKKEATEILEDIGCEKVEYEVQIRHDSSSGGYPYVDVVGYCSDKVIGVECKSSEDGRETFTEELGNYGATYKFADLFDLLMVIWLDGNYEIYQGD